MSHSRVQWVLLGRIEVVTCCNIFLGLRFLDPHCARVVWHENSWLTGLCCWFLSLSHFKKSWIFHSLQIGLFVSSPCRGPLDLNFLKEFGIRSEVSCTKSDSRYGCEIASSLEIHRADPWGIDSCPQWFVEGKGYGRFSKSETKKETFGVPKSIE